MAKASKAGSTSAAPSWQTQWPRNGDLASWFRCMINKCDAIADPAEAATTAHLPIENVAELGQVSVALRAVNRFLRRLGPSHRVEIVRMAELGAEICLDTGDLKRMEKYLRQAADVEKLPKRKCDIGFATNSVRDFRADHGLLDPEDAIDDSQRIKATFNRARRQFENAANDRQARSAAAEMEIAAFQATTDWQRVPYIRSVIETYTQLEDASALGRCVKKLSKAERDEILDRRTLSKAGMKEQAVKCSVEKIKQRLEELAEMDSPNIHFPVRAICDELLFLNENDQQALAQRWLKRVLKDMPKWPVFEFGWTTSAVYSLLAEAVAKIKGIAAAEELIASAYEDGQSERRLEWRHGAVAATIRLQADLGQFEEALSQARKLRSPTEKRKEVAKLLARAGRWRELREVLREVTSPKEAADLCWRIKFELPGGEVR